MAALEEDVKSLKENLVKLMREKEERACRPASRVGDWSTHQTGDATAQEVMRLAIGTPHVTIQTGQWQELSFPFSIPPLRGCLDVLQLQEDCALDV